MILSVSELFTVLLFVAIGWFWQDAMRSKEIARREGRRACDEVGVYFLDDTVALGKLRLCRGRLGRLTLCREYIFEFTSDWSCRYQGRIHMAGREVDELTLDPYRI